MKIVITGASSGIGLALAGHLMDQGHDVWDWSRTNRYDVTYYTLMAEFALYFDGPLHALITCAAINGPMGRTMTSDPAHWANAIATNLLGTFNPIRALWPRLAADPNRRSKVICFAGGGATKAEPGFSAYAASKTAVVRLVETIALEESGANVDINAISPGVIDTPLTRARGLTGGDMKESDANLAMTLSCVDWMLSPASDGISGRLISARWDDWASLKAPLPADRFTLRRQV